MRFQLAFLFPKFSKAQEEEMLKMKLDQLQKEQQQAAPKRSPPRAGCCIRPDFGRVGLSAYPRNLCPSTVAFAFVPNWRLAAGDWRLLITYIRDPRPIAPRPVYVTSRKLRTRGFYPS
jgi:hypothetical protein